jgi:hypothetical protein
MTAEESEERAKRESLKVIKTRDYQVNICDKDLIGNKINDCTISERFYGTQVTEQEAINELEKATLINALGSEAVSLLKQVKGDVVVIDLEGVPHSQFFYIP